MAYHVGCIGLGRVRSNSYQGGYHEPQVCCYNLRLISQTPKIDVASKPTFALGYRSASWDVSYVTGLK